jgi:hypothetical protein
MSQAARGGGGTRCMRGPRSRSLSHNHYCCVCLLQNLSVELKLAGVNVFGNPAKKDSLILVLPDVRNSIAADAAAPLLRGMLAGRVYVKWPYLQEAEVGLQFSGDYWAEEGEGGRQVGLEVGWGESLQVGLFQKSPCRGRRSSTAAEGHAGGACVCLVALPAGSRGVGLDFVCGCVFVGGGGGGRLRFTGGGAGVAPGKNMPGAVRILCPALN